MQTVESPWHLLHMSQCRLARRAHAICFVCVDGVLWVEKQVRGCGQSGMTMVTLPTAGVFLSPASCFPQRGPRESS